VSIAISVWFGIRRRERGEIINQAYVSKQDRSRQETKSGAGARAERGKGKARRLRHKASLESIYVDMRMTALGSITRSFNQPIKIREGRKEEERKTKTRRNVG